MSPGKRDSGNVLQKISNIQNNPPNFRKQRITEVKKGDINGVLIFKSNSNDNE